MNVPFQKIHPIITAHDYQPAPNNSILSEYGFREAAGEGLKCVHYLDTLKITGSE